MPTLNESLRIDKRRMRAEALAHAIFQKVQPLLHRGDDNHLDRDAFYAIFEVCHAEGVEVLTDHRRAELGLRPRGPDGWTDEEVILMERTMQAMMLRQFSPIQFIADNPVAQKDEAK